MKTFSVRRKAVREQESCQSISQQLKNQIPKHLNKLFLVYMRQQCGTDFFGEGGRGAGGAEPGTTGQDNLPPQDSKILVHIPTPKTT